MEDTPLPCPCVFTSAATPPHAGSNFDYGAEITEMILLGVIAVRFVGHIEYDDAQMKITNRPELNAWLRLPARDGWKYSEAV